MSTDLGEGVVFKLSYTTTTAAAAAPAAVAASASATAGGGSGSGGAKTTRLLMDVRLHLISQPRVSSGLLGSEGRT